MAKYSFASDYMEGAHPAILERMLSTNMDKCVGYGLDEFCNSAREKIRVACDAPNAEIHFISGGTQSNSLVIKSLLKPYQGVIAATTGHIAGHEAGAIEHGGHKVLCVPEYNGKLKACDVEKLVKTYQTDDNKDHLVMPGMVYISQPTESGTLYSLSELEDISRVCKANGLHLFLDGARLAYALATPSNDVTLPDLARLCDIFYIGGTKCGALLGEAIVMPDPSLIPHFFTLVKQHGALLAKGRLMGIQFEVLFTDGLYETIGASAIEYADAIRDKLTQKGLPLCYGSPTNQVFVKVPDDIRAKIEEQAIVGFWEKPDDDHTVIRFATSWATSQEDVDGLLNLLETL